MSERAEGTQAVGRIRIREAGFAPTGDAPCQAGRGPTAELSSEADSGGAELSSEADPGLWPPVVRHRSLSGWHT